MNAHADVDHELMLEIRDENTDVAEIVEQRERDILAAFCVTGTGHPDGMVEVAPAEPEVGFAGYVKCDLCGSDLTGLMSWEG